MKFWLITDTHFNHDKMPLYCGRPVGFEEMIMKGLSQIPKEDVLIHLGDICIGKDEYWHKRLAELPFKKWLVLGNHDHKSRSWYLKHGWDFVGAKFQGKFFGKNILFSHTPQKDRDVVELMYISGHFDLNIHGHFHNTLHRLQDGIFLVEGEEERTKIDLANITPKHKLLSIEETNYQPVKLSTFLGI